MSTSDSQTPTDHTQSVSIQTPTRPPLRTIQWGSGAEARLGEDDMEKLSAAIDDMLPGAYASAFPMHGPWGSISLDINGHTLWLYTYGGTFLIGELVDPAIARPRAVPATGAVDISKLDPRMQDAIMTLLKGSKK